ncbi:sigma-70 family RNA polymerase sigma factor [Paenibacillus sp. sgz5001063]|uniref:sigma-70 family RNA polymerase sigma factor n=1 Tax=Paenibacillus sp. sgz5001063 TaxID=3242474 RepID=UPI0036D2B49F
MKDWASKPGTGTSPEPVQGSSLEELFRSYYRYGFSIAYRMLGSVGDAEDTVQDCFAEMQRLGSSNIHNMKAYVAKGITNRCLNMLGSARSRRETYIGQWLPEPVSDAYDEPEASVERKDTLSYAFLVLLELLSPTERAVFVLREAFQYGYDAIAEMVGKSESNCRQIFSRAKRTLQARPTSELHPAPGGSASREQLLNRFTAAFTAYDIEGMLALLGEHPVLVCDGGAKEVHTILRPMKGRKGVLALLTSRRVLKQMHEWEISTNRINGEQNLVFKRQGEVRAVLCLVLDKSGEHIQDLYLMMAASKLGHVN